MARGASKVGSFRDPDFGYVCFSSAFVCCLASFAVPAAISLTPAARCLYFCVVGDIAAVKWPEGLQNLYLYNTKVSGACAFHRRVAPFALPTSCSLLYALP